MPGSPDTWPWLVAGKPVTAAVALAVLWLLETAVPMFPGRDRRVSHDASNLALGVLNAIVGALCFAALVLLVTEWAREHRFGLLHWLDLPAWAAWSVALVLFDGWMYLWHVINHRIPLLWRFHAVHHADREMDVTTALRFHTGEILLSGLARLAVLPLLGMSLPQVLVYEALLLPVILFHHSNVRVPRRLDAVLRMVIVTPWMHWVHHSRWQPETDSNFASILSVWDRLFRTFRLRDDPGSIVMGLDEHTEARHWRTLRGMFLRPFQRW